jgi:hypothetical protein
MDLLAHRWVTNPPTVTFGTILQSITILHGICVSWEHVYVSNHEPILLVVGFQKKTFARSPFLIGAHMGMRGLQSWRALLAT